MDDDRLQAVVEGTTAFLRMLGAAGEDARVLEPEGVLATVVPLCPERSVVNAVVYEDVARLEAAYPALERAYADAGIDAWTVWVPPADHVAAELLSARGHLLDGEPQMMAMSLEAVDRPADDGSVHWSRGADHAAVGAINDAAYGSEGSFERVLGAVPAGVGEWYVAHVGDEPAAGLIMLDDGANSDVDMVATLPSAQGRGLATLLMRHALVDARERGRETATLVATRAGLPVYQRLGFRPFGPIQMWERRSG
jgi:GNAT superfamily N-acetyltransferase